MYIKIRYSNTYDEFRIKSSLLPKIIKIDPYDLYGYLSEPEHIPEEIKIILSAGKLTKTLLNRAYKHTNYRNVPLRKYKKRIY